MKKLYKIIVLLLILTISGCKKSNGYTEINYKELMKKLENKESFILMIESSTCPHCDKFKLTIEEINKKYPIDIKLIDISKLEEDKLLNLKSHFSYTGTPTTFNIIEGEEDTTTRIEGARDYSYVKEKLIKWEYIKE